MATSASKAELEAQLRALEEQLERKRIEEEIRQLQSQLEQVETHEYHDDDEEEYIEEIEEEFTEESFEEEEIEEIIEYIEEEEEEEVACSPPRTGLASATRQRTAVATNTAPSRPKPSTSKPQFVPKLKANNPFTKNLEAKRAAEEAKAKEKASRAMEGQPKPKSARGGAEANPADLPDLPPFTPRTIPKLPASPAGEETPMEKLLGPKLYKQGKLIATTTVAGCNEMDLVLLFFGSYWNRECKPFYALLDDFYKITAIPHNIECIYVSCDKTLQNFKQCFQSMPFLAMPPGTSDLKNHMARELKLVDVPTVVVLDPKSGHVITTEGAQQIEKLQRRNVDECNRLVQQWKTTTPIPFDQVKKDHKLKHGTMDLGLLMWSE